MRLTTRGRYAVTAMLDIAIQPMGNRVSLRDISERHDISVAYLEQLFAQLKKHNLVTSVRGAGGGYLLAQAADCISVLDIINAVNEEIDATACEGKANCSHGARCITHDLWSDLSNHISNYLARISLASLSANRYEQPLLTIKPPGSKPQHYRAQPGLAIEDVF